jgi:polyisoprenyl-teichoic acid--peptidoglycan teichoic acid transferase
MSNVGSLSLSRRTIMGAVAASAMFGSWRSTTVARQAAPVYTFVVIGTDRRTSADPELSDVLMVSRVDLGAGTVRTLSIPRDLYVEVPGYGWAKINEGFNQAVQSDPDQSWASGARGTVETITHNFGLTIDGVAQTDMNLFIEFIDRLGGVTVYNPYDLTDQYWDGMVLPEGPLEMDGELAQRYVRARSQDGDGGRVMRQHLVLLAILEKLQDPAMIPQIPALVTSMSDLVRTDIPLEIQVQLISLLPDLASDDITFGNLESQLWSGYTEGGAWIYQGDWATLPGYVESWLNGTISASAPQGKHQAVVQSNR